MTGDMAGHVCTFAVDKFVHMSGRMVRIMCMVMHRSYTGSKCQTMNKVEGGFREPSGPEPYQFELLD
ncbi:hypothetical protein CRENBAI_007401 [Crenichthys baileyi]|uniref:Uncharacterized protein n=1 Tax=Crenichthys baileyi TaxID=28760 RepID=A0AAV9RV19_9TELE